MKNKVSRTPLDPERDLQIAEAMAREIKPYLLSSILYWSLRPMVSTRHQLPKGTLGTMLMCLHHLSVIQELLTPEQVERLKTAQYIADDQLGQWLVQAEEKALVEVKARLRQWSLFGSDLGKDGYQSVGEYIMQSKSRIALYFVLQTAGKALHGTRYRLQVGSTDKQIRNRVNNTDFILDPQLEPAYPEDEFWWLYALPK